MTATERALLQAFGFEDEAPVALNGHMHHLTCSGCRREFDSKRRQIPGQEAWCEDCRKSGKPAAARQKRHRENKR